MPRPTREELAASYQKTIADVLAPGIRVLFCGINPGRYSGATGFHFAGPGNRFWPALHQSGFTDRLLRPDEVGELPSYGCGITNLVPRTTARADELTPDEIRAGVPALAAKVRRYAPAWLAVVGIGAYRIGFGEKRAALGPQPRELEGAKIWVLPNTSGLNANHRLDDFVREFAALRRRAFARPDVK